MKIDELFDKVEQTESIDTKARLILEELRAKRYDSDFMDMEPFLYQMIEWQVHFSDELYLAYTYDGLSAILFYKDQYDISLEYSFKALEIAERKMDYILSAVSLHLIGLIYYRMENLEIAEKFFLKSVQLNPNFPNVLCNLGLLYYEQGELEKSMYYLDEGLQKSQEQNNRAITGMGLYYKALIEHCNQNLSNAIEFLNKAWRHIDTIADTYLSMSILIEKARILHELKQNSEALNLLNEAVHLANRFSRNALLAKAYHKLAEIYKDDNDYEKAWDYLLKANELENMAKTKEKTDHLSEIQSKYEMNNANQDMIQLINQSPRLTSVGIVSSGIVHEIKQPLSAIKISCESILYWYKRNLGAIPEIVIDQLKDISVSVNYVNKIIEQIRTFWKTNEEQRVRERVELNQFLTEKTALIKNRLKSKDIFIEVVTTESPVYSEINPNCFEQILLYVINISFVIINEHHVSTEQKLNLVLKHEVGFNVIKICFDKNLKFSLEKILSQATDNDQYKSLLLDLKITKYFLNQFNGYISYNDEPYPHLKIAIPGEKGNSNEV
ncbi:MAG TPA: tetratricopeptide repeat protein [Candidatus Cloacimonadota bacterium]|nr:tetratricopeptide repeat protein [Candidatus Cloacimonadota bacterium]